MSLIIDKILNKTTVTNNFSPIRSPKIEKSSDT